MTRGKFTRTVPVNGVGGELRRMARLSEPRPRVIKIVPTAWRTPSGTVTQAPDFKGWSVAALLPGPAPGFGEERRAPWRPLHDLLGEDAADLAGGDTLFGGALLIKPAALGVDLAD